MHTVHPPAKAGARRAANSTPDPTACPGHRLRMVVGLLIGIAFTALGLTALLVAAALPQGNEPPPRHDDGSDDDGGGGSRRRPNGPRPPGEPDPSWWPDFEREFAAYVAGLPIDVSSSHCTRCR